MRIWKENNKDLWESIDLIYDFVAEIKPSILPDKTMLLPEPKIYAQKIIEALAKITEDDEKYKIKAKIALESNHGQFYKGNGWDRPFRDMSVVDIKKVIIQRVEEIKEALLTLEVSPRELMELKAELNTR